MSNDTKPAQTIADEYYGGAGPLHKPTPQPGETVQADVTPVVPEFLAIEPIKPREPYDDEDPDDGYFVSDLEFFEDNRFTAIWLMENFDRLRLLITDHTATVTKLEAERDCYKFNADELRKSQKRQAERYQRTISEHLDRAAAAEASLAAQTELAQYRLKMWSKTAEAFTECQKREEGLREALEPFKRLAGLPEIGIIAGEKSVMLEGEGGRVVPPFDLMKALRKLATLSKGSA